LVKASRGTPTESRAPRPNPVVPPRPDTIGAGGTPQTAIGLWWERHPRTMRALVSCALAWGAVWLAYRLGWSWHGTNPVAFVALVLVELFNWVSLVFLALDGWRWDNEVAPLAPDGERVDVYVCTYNEPYEVVEATLAGCAALNYPHRTYLLDDGRREEMAELATRWDATWITRPDNAHAKAGNINHALHHSDGDLILFLDADHVPLPDALDVTVGYFADPKVAVVQTPHDFYNQDSVQHYSPGRHEQSLFFEVVCPGKDRHNAAFWCGSATVVRRAALVQVGGVATETIAEDFHTTVKMHRRGWRTRYHNQVIVQGLAPVDLDGYLLQRDRWARGNLAVFRLPESPLRSSSGLDRRQRVRYFSSLFAYGSGMSRLLMITVLAVTLGFGVLPARVGALELFAIWLPATVLAISATVALCRGHMRLTESSHYTLVTAEIFARALRCAVWPSRTKFKVTPKEGTDTGGWDAIKRLRVVLALAVALVAAIVWRVLAVYGVVHVRALPGVAAPLAVALGCWELTRVAQAVRRVGKRRQRRVQFRFECRLPAVLAAYTTRPISATISDASVAGIGLIVDVPIEPGTQTRCTTMVPGVDAVFAMITIDGTVRSCRPDADGHFRIGLQVDTLDDESRRRLVTFCHVVHPWRQLRPRHVWAGPDYLAPLAEMQRSEAVAQFGELTLSLDTVVRGTHSILET
jgi:cellulose synthase (UDP-forming)